MRRRSVAIASGSRHRPLRGELRGEVLLVDGADAAQLEVVDERLLRRADAANAARRGEQRDGEGGGRAGHSALRDYGAERRNAPEVCDGRAGAGRAAPRRDRLSG
jgi:hypothetical protein